MSINSQNNVGPLMSPMPAVNFFNNIANALSEGISFLKRFISNPSQVGAIAPSSQALAVQITSAISDGSQEATLVHQSKRFLEIGAGTGVFTREIVKKMGPGDHLDVVEYDHAFCEQLTAEFGNNPQVHIHEVSITDFNAEGYDAIVSGLPLNAFGPEFVGQVLQKYEDLAKPGATISYFEYIGLEKIKKVFLFGKELKDFEAVLAHKQSFVERHNATHEEVYFNFPPARVQYCQMDSEEKNYLMVNIDGN